MLFTSSFRDVMVFLIFVLLFSYFIFILFLIFVQYFYFPKRETEEGLKNARQNSINTR